MSQSPKKISSGNESRTNQPGNSCEVENVFEPVKHREEWLRRLADEFIKLESVMPMANFLPDEGCPMWVENLEREVGATMYPAAKQGGIETDTPSAGSDFRASVRGCSLDDGMADRRN
jgi:hypothetical protein